MSTEKSGIINSDQTWSGNILVTGSVKVTNGATLTISAGTQITVQSGGDYKIWIDSTGFLKVDNPSDLYTKIGSDGSGTDDWQGIQFTNNTSSNSSSGSNLVGLTISNATYGVEVEGQGLLIDGCVFENNAKSIYLTNADSVKITQSTFKDTNGCIDTPYEGGGTFNNIEIIDNQFLGGGTAAAIWPNQRNVDDLTITNNLVADSHSLGFQVGGGGYGSHIGDVEISNNEIKSTSGISIDAYSWVNDDTPGLKINKNYISGTGTGIAFGHADSFSTNNIQINENHFKNNGTSLSYGNDQNFGTGPHFSLTGNVFDSVGIGTDLKGLAVTASSNSFANTSNYVIKNANANTSFSGNNITSFSGTSVFHTRDTSNLGTAISLGTNYFDSTSKSADLADDGAENFEYKTIEVSGYAGSAYSVSLPADVPTNASPTLSGSKKSFSDGTEDTNYLITKTDLLTGYSDAEFDTLSISGLAFSSGSSSQSGDNYTYTPTSGTTGSITISYSITDGDGGTLSASNSLNIQASDDGDASFAISGTTQVGQSLSITESTADPDGTGTLSYVWQSSSDETTWTQIGTNSTYTLTSSEEGKKIRAILSYTDDQGFSESVTATAVEIKTDDGDAVFVISGTTEVGQALSITESTADPDGTGTLSYVWQSSSDETTWSQIGTDSTYTLTTSEEGKKVRAILSYTDGQGFAESVTTSSTSSIPFIDSGDAVFEISGTTQLGQALSITESTADPDGTGTLSYVWQSSSDETTWTQIGTNSTYTLTSSEEGKKIRAILSYTDEQGFAESLTTSSVDLIDDGDATFTINSSGNKLAGDNLSITESSADPDGIGTLSYVWQSSSDEATWSQIGTDSTYTITSSEEGKKVRVIISYTDGQGFSESVTTSSIAINSKTYSLSTTINSPQEGYELTTTASTENITEGSTLYWSLSGTDISITDFASGSLTGSGTVGSDGTFSFKHSIANDGETEGYETIDIKLFSDSERTTQVGETESILIRDAAIEEQIAEIVEDLNGVKQVVSQLVKGQNYTLNNIRDYDGNLHANSADEDVSSSYKYQHALDVNGDGTLEAIYTNMKSGRWVTASINPLTGKVDYSDYGQDGTTRVVGIYDDPLIAEGAQNNGYLSDGVTPAPANFGVSDTDRYVQYNGETVDRLALNSQVRFQNDLKIDNLIAKKSNDFDSDGIREVYWKTSDGTAYLRALMHADGNIRYANYQSESQMTDYLTNNGLSDSITEIIS